MRPPCRRRSKFAAAALCAVGALSCIFSSVAMAVPGSSYGDIAGPFLDPSSGLELLWVRADYTGWRTSGSHLPALVTSSPTGTPDADAGVLGKPTTTLLAGNVMQGDGWRSGWMLSGGLWLDRSCGTAITAEYLSAGRDGYNFSIGPDTGGFIARPYFDTQAGSEAAFFVERPALFTGNVRVDAFQDFEGSGGGLQTSLWAFNDIDQGRLTQSWIYTGYRNYYHDSIVLIRQDSTLLVNRTIGGNAVPAGTEVGYRDNFGGRNDFQGWEFGLSGRTQSGNWWLDGAALFAVGGTHRTVFVDGTTTVDLQSTRAPVDASFPDGVLVTRATNSGRYKSSRGSIIPRLRMGFGMKLTEHATLRSGYNVIIWDDIVQAADHMPPDRRVDKRNSDDPPTGGPDPVFPGIQGSLFVAHGFDVGVEFNY